MENHFRPLAREKMAIDAGKGWSGQSLAPIVQSGDRPPTGENWCQFRENWCQFKFHPGKIGVSLSFTRIIAPTPSAHADTE